jgi:Cysteine dioxygenase type I
MTYSAGTQARQHRPDALIVGPPKAKLDVTRTALQLAADRSRWEGLIRFDAISRCRISLDVDGEYEAWLLTWLPGQHTVWHDHGGSIRSSRPGDVADPRTSQEQAEHPRVHQVYRACDLRSLHWLMRIGGAVR